MTDEKFILKVFAVIKDRKSAFDLAQKVLVVLSDESTSNVDIQVGEASAFEKASAE